MALVNLSQPDILMSPPQPRYSPSQHLNVLKRIKRDMGTSYILITHDMPLQRTGRRCGWMYGRANCRTSGRRPLFCRAVASLRNAHGQRASLAWWQPLEFIAGQPPSLVNRHGLSLCLALAPLA